MVCSIKRFAHGVIIPVVLVYAFVGCVDVTPEGTGEVPGAKRACSSDTACVFDGVLNRSLGAARLRLNDKNNLIVENIGTDGSDGVRQFAVPDDTILMETGLACPNFVESVQGSKAVIVMYADTPTEVASTLTLENTDGRTITTSADLSPAFGESSTARSMYCKASESRF